MTLNAALSQPLCTEPTSVGDVPDSALAVGGLIHALNVWKATTIDTAPPAWRALLDAAATLVASDGQDQSASSVKPEDAAHDVLAERRRQIEAEGWTPERDDQYSSGEMAEAAAAYASESAQTHAGLPNGWPWSVHWWKPGTPRENLVKAGALILAEIERIDRAEKVKDL